jgi:hypothetical protein
MTDTPAPAADKADSATDAAKSMEHMIPKARLDEEIGKRHALESEYAEFADAVLAEIPDRLKSLVPADLGPAARLRWYREAKKTGVFDSKPNVPETDKGKPATTPTDRDLSTLPVHARIAAGYGKRG